MMKKIAPKAYFHLLQFSNFKTIFSAVTEWIKPHTTKEH